ncbi:Grx4 family monothiol glutaredoxin [Wolbachia endosymbiont of Howardula sp.]|uniref:Grx4 family monothiol glutaredoxin n=1 Tax=Wolbachia endosymbiont of Howardula sp. TaxID=2916816 RepID=UPI00217F1919|nr:Grx4 family monothiol glutaredoxin [Wolbachia endosymbiont of Howardula sp.]UWI83197.1 Grx4 family monothiol glutaredoxin [Wolbachia endosymbiont of Howardula sp.]
MSIFEQIKKEIEENDIILYMKGTAECPQCGFSSIVVSILKKFNVQFKCVNVLESDEIREAIKKFSDWPTVPQLYIKGEFIGGSDIIREIYDSGELNSLLKNKGLLG